MQFIKKVAFFGYTEAKPKDLLYKEAFEVAKMLGQKGFVIVNGGGPGVMTASSNGARAANGETLAVTFYPENAPGFEGRYPRNITDKEIITSNYIERMFKLLEHSDICIIFKGGTGTLSEFATAWCLGRLYFGLHKPIILYGKFWKKILSCLKKNLFLRGNENKIYKIVNSPEEVLTAIAEFEKEFIGRLKRFMSAKNERAFTQGGLAYQK